MTAHPKQLHDFGKASPHRVSQTGMDAADVSGDELIEAAAEVLDCMRVLAKSGSNLVAEALGTHEFTEWDHYPPDDVRDPERSTKIGVSKSRPRAISPSRSRFAASASSKMNRLRGVPNSKVVCQANAALHSLEPEPYE